jgi:hypothetical protein
VRISLFGWLGQGTPYDVEVAGNIPTEREPSTTMRFFLNRLAVGMAKGLDGGNAKVK